MLGKMIANNLVKAGNAPLFDNPNHYGLTYEDVTFQASDGVTLRGWLIKGGTDKVIIQTHFGLFSCRSGYTNQGRHLVKGYSDDVRFLRQAKYLNEAGYSVLLYDLRNHGESDQATDGFVSYGPEEAKDVIAAVDYISRHPDYTNASIGLLSICLGYGASVCAFGRDDGLKNYPNINCMISLQPMDYAHFVKGMKVPDFIKRSASKYIENHAPFDYLKDTWRPYVKDVRVPTLMIQNLNDGFLDRDFVQGVFDDLEVDKEMMWLELPDLKNPTYNRMATYDWLGTNPEPVLGWFGKYL